MSGARSGESEVAARDAASGQATVCWHAGRWRDAPGLLRRLAQSVSPEARCCSTGSCWRLFAERQDRRPCVRQPDDTTAS